MHDLIIIGAGPAGITASVYASRKKLDTLVVTGDIGGQTAWSGEIENYTGYQFITGPDLAYKFEEHMRKYGINLKENESVKSVSREGDSLKVVSDKATYLGRSVIIASGKRTRELGVPGETEFKNKGLTYCATCDGPLFSGKDVAIIGGGNSALDAALQLVRIAKHLFIVNIAPDFTGDPVMREQVINNKLVTIFNNSNVEAVEGDKMVTGVRINRQGEQQALSVQGVFVEIGLIPNSEFAQGIGKNQTGEIKVNVFNETNIEGIFAAGDVTDVPEKQIIIAAGEGAKAALSAFRYLMRHPLA